MLGFNDRKRAAANTSSRGGRNKVLGVLGAAGVALAGNYLRKRNKGTASGVVNSAADTTKAAASSVKPEYS